MAQLAEERQKTILSAARKKGSVVISSIADDLGVSEMTVRRDLKRLEAQGLLNRVHGGAVPAPESRFGARLEKQSPAKAAAALKLAEFIPPEGTIYLDGSTTMLHLLSRLANADNLQVATNNVETFQRLGKHRGVHPILIGGQLDRRTDNLAGALALRSILAIVFDAAFFSAWCIRPEIGPMEVTLEDAEVKDLVASRSQSVYIAVDDTKLGRSASGAWLPERNKTTLATNLRANDPSLSIYRERFSKII